MPSPALRVSQKPASSRWLTPAIAAGLVLITLTAFYGLHRCEFVNLDDFAYVVNNPHVNKGLSWSVVTWAFTHAYACNWHPLTWLSHALDCQIYSLNPAGHHVTNLLLHSLSTAVLFFALRRMTGAIWRSAFVAALFAVHPQHVESVAWVSERKDVLSGLFFMLTLYAYARYAELKTSKLRRANRAPMTTRSDARIPMHFWYIVTLTFFSFGLMSKPMIVTLPFVLLLLDFWPLRRVRLAGGETAIGPLVLEKSPFIALGVVSSLVTILVQQASRISLSSVSMSERWGNALLSCVAYLRQLFWPAGLAAYYPYPKPVLMDAAAAAAFLLVAITLVLVMLRKSSPFALIGWLWFLGMLVPVIGIVQVGAQARADRYMYLPSIGIFFGVTWVAVKLFSSRRHLALAVVGGATLACLAFATQLQAQWWHDSARLFSHAAEVVPDNYFAMTQIAMTELKTGKVEAARARLSRALELEPAYPVANHHMGVALLQLGQATNAIPYLKRAESRPELSASAHLTLALAYLQIGNLREARANLDRADEEKPGEADIAVVRATLLLREGESSAAERLYRQVLDGHPDHTQARIDFANFLLDQNRPAEALPLFVSSVNQRPSDVSLRTALASCLTMQGRFGEALKELQTAQNLDPKNAMIWFQTAEVLSQSRNTFAALASYEKTLELNPAFAAAMNNLAWILATNPNDKLRNGGRAVELAERACDLTKWEMPMLIGTLAAAYAEAGRFEDAIRTAERARDQAKASSQEQVAGKNEELLQLYRAAKPYRDVESRAQVPGL